MNSSNLDRDVRAAVFSYLEALSGIHGEILPSSALTGGFDFRGTRIQLMFPQRGIWKPALLPKYPISITTSPGDPYGDVYDERTKTLQYRYFGSNPDHANNRGLRLAMMDSVPLVHFHGLVSGRYMASWPCFVVTDDPANLTFGVQIDEFKMLHQGSVADAPDAGSGFVSGIRREYATRSVQARVHQQKFRMRVLAAYRTQCTFCRLRHESLLQAAHIIPDSDAAGVPEVSNGLALCALHHSAYDKFFIAVRPDYTIEVRPDIRRESDGPTLVHAVQALHGASIFLPRRVLDRPDPDRLEVRYLQYAEYVRAAGFSS